MVGFPSSRRMRLAAVVAFSAVLAACARSSSEEAAFRAFATQVLTADPADADRLDLTRFDRLAPETAAAALETLTLPSAYGPGLHLDLSLPGFPGETWALWVPESIDEEGRRPVLFTPGHAAYRRDPRVEMESIRDRAGATDCLIVRTGFFDGHVESGRYEERLRDDLVSLASDFNARAEALLREVFVHAKGDPDRVYVTGFSMAGYWSWELALTMPHRFAGVLPVAAVSEPFRELLSGAGDLPVALVHGTRDTRVPINETRATRDLLARLGQPHRLWEIPDADHTGAQAGWAEAFAWLRAHTRDPWPPTLRLTPWSPKFASATGLRFDFGDGNAPDATPYRPWLRGEVRVRDGSITLSDRIPLAAGSGGSVALLLSPEWVDLSGTLTVAGEGGRLLYSGRAAPLASTMLEHLRRTGDTGAVVWAEVKVKGGE